ncbi:hypothetical protein NP493_768g01027 [Ridgeia piscesae]|uniref:Helicase C-terminal domain-containing protein n=1 Tax=Ridgeia piscesae TaxID=27915 RepID=A0AAD9KNP7_RIDPI|nr:hypothetical protein NP493_768g01027 [Ridgeia piscesae]
MAEVVSQNDSEFKEFSPDTDRLDTFFYKNMEGPLHFSKLWPFIKKLLILSHGQATVERGFSINTQLLVENLKADSFVSQLEPERKNVKQTERHLLLKALKHAGNGHLCPVLRKTVVCGVAYHHGGLTTDERKLIEEAYAGATLCVLTCTSTLAAGVNLPAKRVILRSPYVGMGFISRSQYKQMTGRAGRAGIDSSGESIIICQTKDKQQLTTSVQSIQTFLRRTLCHVQSTQLDIDLVSLASTELQTLLDVGLVKLTSGQNGELEVTSLGRATFKGSVDIDRANQLYTDLRTALQSLTLANHLHLLYLVTPYDLGSQVRPSWMTYFNQMNNLDESELKVAALVGVSESYITKKASGQRTRKNVDEDVVERFYLTLILYSLWRQQSVWEVAAKFQLPRGFIQQLLTGAASFASCVLHFSQELDDLWALQDLLPGFVKRLSYCVTMELLPLVEIPAVSIGRARQLYRAGYKTLQQVAYAESSALVKVIEFLSHKAAKQIIASAKLLLTEKVESLRDEADVMTTIPVDMPTKTVTLATEPGSSPASSLTLSRSQTIRRS